MPNHAVTCSAPKTVRIRAFPAQERPLMRKPVRKATGHVGTFGARRGWTRRAKRFTFGRMSTGIMSGCFIVDKNGLGPFSGIISSTAARIRTRPPTATVREAVAGPHAPIHTYVSASRSFRSPACPRLSRMESARLANLISAFPNLLENTQPSRYPRLWLKRET